jgi:hypothetical protein
MPTHTGPLLTSLWHFTRLLSLPKIDEVTPKMADAFEGVTRIFQNVKPENLNASRQPRPPDRKNKGPLVSAHSLKSFAGMGISSAGDRQAAKRPCQAHFL